MEHDDIRVRIENIRHRMAEAADRSGRSLTDVRLLGASKQVDPERILKAIQLGVEDIGENRVQEAEAKFKTLAPLRLSATWHMIGTLQSNKVRPAVELFDVIQPVDSFVLANRIDRISNESGKFTSIYIEVNLAGEESKTGVTPDNVTTLANTIAECDHIRLAGLMAVPPVLENIEDVRPYFKRLRDLRDALNQQSSFDQALLGLSIGMTHDYEIAIEEGSTMIRLGTAIWGPRPN